MADNLIYRFQNPPRMSVAANRDHLERLLYELIADGAAELERLSAEVARLQNYHAALSPNLDKAALQIALAEARADAASWEQQCNDAREMGLRLSAELEVARRDGERLFDAGWKMAASWAGRDDLLADMDSNTFKADRLAAIDAARESGDG